MADENRMITFNYARTTWDQYAKTLIPSSNKCMTKAEINQYLNAEPAPLADYADNRLVPRSRFVGFSSTKLPTNLVYTFEDQAIIEGQIYYKAVFDTVIPYSPIILGKALRTSTGRPDVLVNSFNNIANIIGDILTLTSAPIQGLTMKRLPLIVEGQTGDQIFILGKRMFGNNNVEFSPNEEWRLLTPINLYNYLNNLDAQFLVNTSYGNSSDDYFSFWNLYTGGPTNVSTKFFNVTIYNGTENPYYRSLKFTPKPMPLHLEFFSFGISIGTATIKFSPL